MDQSTIWEVCSESIQAELNYYSRLTGLDFDFNDKNAYRIAGTGKFSSMIHANNYYPYGSIAAVRERKEPVLIKSRECSICKKCGTNTLCKYKAEIVIPVFLHHNFSATLSTFCINDGTYQDFLKQPEAYQKLAEHIASIITALGDRILAHDKNHMLSNSLDFFVLHSSECVLLMEGKKIIYISPAAKNDLNNRGVSVDKLLKEQLIIFTRKTSNKITLRTSDNLSISMNGFIFQPPSSMFSDLKRTTILIFSPEATKNFVQMANLYPSFSLENFQGQSKSFVKTMKEAMHLSSTREHFLIQGEHGIVKVLWAKAINYSPSQQIHPFLVYDSTVFSDAAYSELLFDPQNGIFSTPESTICLKEISQFPYWIQKKIANAADMIAANHIRLIGTTSVEMKHLQKDSFSCLEFLLLFQDNVLTVDPLRKRGEDIPVYIQNYLYHLSQHEGKSITCSKAALNRLVSYSWPGNFVEIEQVLSYLVHQNTTGILEEADVLKLPMFKEQDASLNLSMQEKKLLEKALRLYPDKCDRKKVADILGISQATLYRKIDKYKL